MGGDDSGGAPRWGTADFDRYVEASRAPYTYIIPGMTLPIRFDPSEPSRVEIDVPALEVEKKTGVSAVSSHAANVQFIVADPSGTVSSPAATSEITDAIEAAGGAGALREVDRSDTVEGLEKLADLHDRGVLTDAEFAAQKATILGEA